MAPRYSVLLPTHNRRDVIGYAISSVLKQTEADFELLVVGDGCTDGTGEVVASFGDPRIRWFDLPKAPNFGYANRNIVLREARGELMAFAAHDDILLPDHLALVGAPFADRSVELAYSRPLWVADDGRVVPFAVDLRVAEQLDTFLTDHNSIPASCVIYRRDCHERVGYWPQDIAKGGDWAIWRRIIGSSRGANLAYVTDATALHFRADWQTGATWGPAPLGAWLAEASTDAWPHSLRLEVDSDRSPQDVAWERISRDGPSWTRELRAGVEEALSYLAWTSGTRLAKAGEEMAVLLTRAAEAERRASLADAALANQRSSSLILRVARRLRLALLGNPLFDAYWYAERYGDVTSGEAHRHWSRVGAANLRDPNAWFSTRAYLERYPDVQSIEMNPLDHYYAYGAAEGRSPAPDGPAPA